MKTKKGPQVPLKRLQFLRNERGAGDKYKALGSMKEVLGLYGLGKSQIEARPF